ncbi:60S acidic ribosomal protein P1 [Irineochytrium annulatum]|nr:60S acidic ribosomal protein P1 [Irineochytrium annulatum]
MAEIVCHRSDLRQNALGEIASAGRTRWGPDSEDNVVGADKLSTLIESAGIEVESIWPNLFAKALAGKDIGAFLMNVGAGGGAPAAGGAVAAPAAGGAGGAKAEEKKVEKEEEKEESDDDMGFGLFD